MNRSNLDFLFSPRSIAVVGVSDDWNKFNEGRRYVESFVKSGFKGNLYGVNPRGGEVFGVKLYPSISDIPDNIDYVVLATPAQSIPQLAAECASKGVKAIQIYAGGFGETGDDKGRQLQSELQTIALRNDIRIIGPNSVGLYCPKRGLSFSVDFPGKSGPVGLVAQSGGNPTYCIREGASRGLYFSKVIGCGNASDLDEADFISYLQSDPETEIIAAYIEGVKDASRFAEAVCQASESKPVIIYKSGLTEAGARATASHTAHSFVSGDSWRRLLSGTGAIQVNTVEEIVDVALLFRVMSVPKGRRVAVIGAGGAATVKAGDNLSEGGFTVPALPLKTRREVESLFPVKAGRIFDNPVDINFPNPQLLLNTAKLIAADDGFDLMIIHIGFDSWGLTTATERTALLEPCMDALIRLKGMTRKPTAIVLHSYVTHQGKQFASRAVRKLSATGLPVYPSFERATRAIDAFMKYDEWRQNI